MLIRKYNNNKCIETLLKLNFFKEFRKYFEKCHARFKILFKNKITL